MPGNKKAQSQRTKGNVKPSSSSQAAQLLAASGQAPSGFIGFSTQPAFVPASETFDDAESTLDGDFRLVLRKFSKRDTVTKIKALREFITLCGTKDEETVKAVVSFWPRIYNKIAIDVDHKVRELSQKALSTLAARTGKAIAPHLKSIMGMWMVSMCDTYPTVASAANTAFTSTFPPAKQVEAVRFCQAEIIECLLDNILKQTAQTLSDPKTTSEEDMESKYNRVVSSSFQALRKFLFMLSSDSVSSSTTSHLSSLLTSSAFWKHTKSPLPQVKSGVLSLLSATCQLCPDASSKVLNKISPFVFMSLDSTDPNLVSYAWEAMLSLISAHQDCWQHVNWQKAVWPKIKHVLETGCSGQAATVAPCFLPLLSRIPSPNFTQFFDSFRLGFNDEAVLNSPSDMSSLVRSFTECIQYSVKTIGETGNNAAEIRNLILDQVLVVVQASLTDTKSSLSKTDLYANLCPLLTAVSAFDSNVEKDFWSDLSMFTRGRLMADFLDTNKNKELKTEGSPTKMKSNEAKISDRLNLLVQGLVFQETKTVSKKEKVRFAASEARSHQKKSNFDKEKQKLSDEAETFLCDMFVSVFRLANINEKCGPLFFNVFRNLAVLHIPCKAAERLKNKSDPVAVSLSVDLGLEPGVSLTSSVEEDLANAFKSKLALTGSDSGKINHYQDFLCNCLVKLLFYAQGKDNLQSLGGGSFTDDLIITIFAFLSYMDEQEGSKLLQAMLDNMTEPETTCQFIEHLLEHVKWIPACRQLVESTELAGKIEELTTAVIGGEKHNKVGDGRDMSNAVWKMLTSVVASLDESDCHLFSQSCLDSAMSSCVLTLRKLQENDTNSSVDTLSCVLDLVQALLDKHKVSTHLQLGELVLSLLPVLLKTFCAKSEESVLLQSVWLAGFQLILEKKSDQEIQEHTGLTCELIRDWVKSQVSSLEELDRVSMAVKLLGKTVYWPSSLSVDQDTEESDSKDRTEIDMECDGETFCQVLDSLLIVSCGVLDGVKELYEYLYICGSLQSLPSTKPANPDSLQSLPSYLMGTLHNLRVLLVNLDLMANDSSIDSKCQEWSEVQLQCFTELSYRLILVESACKIKQEVYKEFSHAITELRTGLIRCFKTLSREQLSSVVDIAVHKQNESCVYTLGVKSVLELLMKTLVEKSEKVNLSLQLALLSCRMEFLHRCLPSDELVCEVSELLSQSAVSGHNICGAFALASTVILSCEYINIRSIADCVSGFMLAARDYDVLQEEVKMSLFQQIVDIVKQLKDQGIHLLTGSNAISPSAKDIQLNTSIAQALKLLIVPCNEQFWEFTLCALVEWIQFISEMKVNLTSDTLTKALLVSVSELAHQAAHTFTTASVAVEVTPESSTSVTEKAKTEWNEFFSEGIFSPLLPMFVSSALLDPSTEDPIWPVVIQPLACAVSLCPSWLVLNHQLPAKLTATDTSSIPDTLKTVLNHLCPLLMSRERCVSVAAYKLLDSIIEEIPKHETGSEEEGKQEEEVRSPPEALIQQTETAARFLDCLKVAEIDDHIVMYRGTDEHSQAMGYLLSWRLLLNLFECSPNQMRAKYAQYFKTNDSVSDLLDHLFRLIPPHPPPSLLEFTPHLDAQAAGQENELGAQAVYVYHRCLQVLPALVRTWWVGLDRKSSNFIDKFTTQYFSGSLIWQQTTSAQSTENDMQGITIRARPAAREVSATYEMEGEVTVNMSIVLPENYPLGKLDVSCDKRVGVSQAQWDRWLLQLNIFLQHQNGSMVEGLRLWKGNIDKKFEGVDDCMICFSVIHGTSFQLPRITCRTCRKKFHSACLYKWFSTSQKSSCPLCRELF